MIDKETVIRLVEEKLLTSTNYLVDVKINPGNVIVVEIDNDEGVGIDDCAELSRHIESSLLEHEEDYELEVGSSGISTPFKTLRQYLKNVGKEVECLLKSGKKLTGILKSADENTVSLAIEKLVKPEGAKRKQKVVEEESFQHDEIKYVKCVIRFK